MNTLIFQIIVIWYLIGVVGTCLIARLHVKHDKLDLKLEDVIIMPIISIGGLIVLFMSFKALYNEKKNIIIVSTDKYKKD